MSKFTAFILFNILAYFAYWVIDRLFSLLRWYSNPKLGEDIMVMPTTSDIWLIALNVLFSTVIAWYLLHKIKTTYLS
ncbi:MAG: hypothetical protein DSZ05_08390 [Sulfurospirillum sp.]|nr:MAG: hypothetical protein DSZ05_08390 [Sulfurospirillum sp.]